jgi:isochorismate hydrolase
LPDTAGAEIHGSVHPGSDEPIFRRPYPNSFRETHLLEYLRRAKLSRLVIAGMMTQVCIDTTTRAAADLGFACFLAHDACATKALSFNGLQVPAEYVRAAYLAALKRPLCESSVSGRVVRPPLTRRPDGMRRRVGLRRIGETSSERRKPLT